MFIELVTVYWSISSWMSSFKYLGRVAGAAAGVEEAEGVAKIPLISSSEYRLSLCFRTLGGLIRAVSRLLEGMKVMQ